MTPDVLNHLRDLQENLQDWESYLDKITRTRFISDRGERHKLLHAALVALQAAIDIANHWAAELTPQRPESYRAIVELLQEQKALPAALAKDLRGLFSLRNVLIHKYQELDLRRLYRHLRLGLKPLKNFLALSKTQVR